ncbi:Ribosome-binding protein 1 [Holothuria leucospilota]|uniref:Ribosome-binding protein 1 n=1 Tax=Holothuria leucospilota TaxID=206669 RepID=A0A9Q1BGB1_HOLLE|nr:Ribosome-binding protein 1 [Holothuria leucospilota]
MSELGPSNAPIKKMNVAEEIRINAHPLIGVECMTEYEHVEPYQEPHYECSVCQFLLMPGNVIPHLMGYKHRVKYVETFRPELFNEFIRPTADRHNLLKSSGEFIDDDKKAKGTLSGRARDVAVEIEKREGRRMMKTVVLRGQKVPSQLRTGQIHFSEIGRMGGMHDWSFKAVDDGWNFSEAAVNWGYQGGGHMGMGHGPGHMGMGPDGPGPRGMGPDGPGPMGMGPDGPGPMGMGPDGPGPMGMGPDGPGPMGMGPDGPGPRGMGPDGPGPRGMGPDGPGPRGMGPDGPGPRGMGPDGPGPRGMGPDGPGPRGMGPDGPGPRGMGPDGPGPRGMGPDGPGPRGMGPDGPGQRGMGPDGPGQRGMGPDGPGQRGMGPDGPGPRGMGPDGPGPRGMGPDGPGPRGMGPDGPGPRGMGPDGPGPRGMGPDGPSPGGMGRDGPGPMGMGPDGPGPMGMRPDGPGMMGMGPDGPGPIGMRPDGPGNMGMRPDGSGPMGMGPDGPGHMRGNMGMGNDGPGPMGMRAMGPESGGPGWMDPRAERTGPHTQHFFTEADINPQLLSDEFIKREYERRFGGKKKNSHQPPLPDGPPSKKPRPPPPPGNMPDSDADSSEKMQNLFNELSTSMIKNEEDASMALQVSNTLTEALLNYRLKSLRKGGGTYPLGESITIRATSHLTESSRYHKKSLFHCASISCSPHPSIGGRDCRCTSGCNTSDICISYCHMLYQPRPLRDQTPVLQTSLQEHHNVSLDRNSATCFQVSTPSTVTIEFWVSDRISK